MRTLINYKEKQVKVQNQSHSTQCLLYAINEPMICETKLHINMHNLI